MRKCKHPLRYPSLVIIGLVLVASVVLATISTEVTRIQYAGNDATTVFPYTFKVFANTELQVIVRDSSGNETIQTRPTHYSVSGVGVATGGNVTMVTAPATGETLTILRNMPLKQLTDYTPGGRFPAESHENALDKIVMRLQQLEERLDRSIHVKKTSTLTDIEFSEFDAGEYVRVNLTADGLDSTDAVYDLGNFLQSGTGAVSRTAASKMGEILSVKDFGAVGDGVADDTLAIQAAIDAAEAAGGGDVLMSNGTFSISSTINMKAYINLKGASWRGTIIEPATADFPAITCDSEQIRSFTISNLSVIYKTQAADASAVCILIGNQSGTYPFDFILENLYLRKGYNAIKDASPAWDYQIRQVVGYETGEDAFKINPYGAGAKTLITIDECYAGGGSLGDGFDMSGIQNLTMKNCSVDNVALMPFRLTTCIGVMIACHIEGNTVSNNLVTLSNSNMTLLSCYIASNTITGSDVSQRNVFKASSGANIVMIACKVAAQAMAGDGGETFTNMLGADSTSHLISIIGEYADMTGTGTYRLTNNVDEHNVDVWDDDVFELHHTAIAPFPHTFTDTDTTPSVAGGNSFITNTTGATITRFDDGLVGQEITILSKGVIVFDTTANARLIGSSVDITTASGDVTTWVCETGGTTSSVWRLKGFVDVSVDNSAGA